MYKNKVEVLRKLMVKCPKCKQKEYLIGTICKKCGFDGTYHNSYPINPIIR